MRYKGKYLSEISFPIGGIGTGSIGLAGNGSLIDWEIFNRPNKGSINGYSGFAIKSEFPDGKTVTKMLLGDLTKDLSGKFTRVRGNGFGFGPDSATLCGFPHFKTVKFDGNFPIATLTFEDSAFPAKVILTAFNPFIPLDADNSSIPAAFFDIKVKSLYDDVKYTVIFSVNNPFETSKNIKIEHEYYTAIKMLYDGIDKSDKSYGDMTVAVDKADGFYQEYWYRGAWQDKITTFWRDLTDGNLKNRNYTDSGKADMCSVGATETINKSKSKSFRFVLAWNVSNNYNYWSPYTDENGNHITWKNYYATLFKDSADSCFYSLNNWNSLYTKTKDFCKSLHSSTLDKSVIDAISSTISVLKSPTVFRLEDGTFYGFEGVSEQWGSCAGTCTHVWSYAYALCFLFPELERSMRDAEFTYSTEENGMMRFRTVLPLGRKNEFHLFCLDGQMATVIKIYRDWKITGNSKWLSENWNNITKVLDFAFSESNPHKWDRNKDGVLEGRQHHTLDMELFGPSSWLQGMYLAALKAASEMADFLGDTNKKNEYGELYEKGYKWTKNNLFNGKYFYHKVDLKNKKYTEEFDCPNYWNEEKNEIKYQIGEGSIIDQLLGQWHSNICGLGDIFDKKQRKIALSYMFKNNFKKSFRNFANMWRVFALNDEGGAIMCDYPDDVRKPIIPIPYCEECMTGFEYSFAGLLISEGYIEEGLTVVRAVRDRYDGKKRNPYNEIECGSNYARPMSSFALLPIFSGFEFDLPKKHIGFAPVLSGDFRCFWSLGTGWGDFSKNDNEYKVIIKSGCLELSSFSLGTKNTVSSVIADGSKIKFSQKGNKIIFDTINIRKSLVIEVRS